MQINQFDLLKIFTNKTESIAQAERSEFSKKFIDQASELYHGMVIFLT